jgi:hypothetical protein
MRGAEAPAIVRKQRNTAHRAAKGRDAPATAQPLLRRRRSEHVAALTASRRGPMLETIAIILIVLWLLGMVSGYTLGNFIYVLLVIAIVLFLVRLISGRTV